MKLDNCLPTAMIKFLTLKAKIIMWKNSSKLFKCLMEYSILQVVPAMILPSVKIIKQYMYMEESPVTLNSMKDSSSTSLDLMSFKVGKKSK